jgi:hypothetical protein
MPNVTLVDSNQVALDAVSGGADVGNPIKIGGVAQDTTLSQVDNGDRVNVATNRYGILYVTVPDYNGTAGNDGTALSGFGRRDIGIGSAPTPVATGSYLFNGTLWDRRRKPNLTSRIPSSAATTNATSAKASAGNVHQIIAMNTTAAVKYLKLYNKASAPTVGTDTPVLTIPLEVSNRLVQINLADGGLYFSTGIAYALTGAAADADATALAAGDVVGLNIAYS